MGKILLLIPQNRKNNSEQGGQITAANGLIYYLQENKFDYEIINTTPTKQEKKYKILKIFAAVKRVFNSYTILKNRETKYMIMFKSGIFGLVERYLMSLICKKYNVKSSVFFRNSDILNIKPVGFRYTLLHNLLNSFDILFVQGNGWKEHLSKFAIDQNKIYVVPNWLPSSINLQKQSKTIQQNEKIKFIFTGRIVREKGVFEILEAVKFLSNYTNFDVLILGDGPDKSLLADNIKENNLKNIYLLGWKSSEEVHEILSASHVLLLPSYQEGFPNSILEAMACGLPIITTNVGAIGESVFNGYNGYIINKKSSIELANAMKQYLDDVGLISIQSEKSLEMVKKRHDRNVNCELIFQALNMKKS